MKLQSFSTRWRQEIKSFNYQYILIFVKINIIGYQHMTIATCIKSKNLLHRYRNEYVHFMTICSENLVDKFNI